MNIKTSELNKGDYFKIKDSEEVYDCRRVIHRNVVFGESCIIECVCVSSDMLCHLFPDVEVSSVLTEEEKEKVKDYYGI